MNNQRVILGIDPGTNILGYGVILVDTKKTHYVDMGVLDLRKEKDHFVKIKKIFDCVSELIDKYNPTDLAVEAPFYGKNVQSMLKLGRAQGVAMAAAISRDVPISEYAPLKIKMSITGSGRASKEQVSYMLQKILKIPDENMLRQLDASDGLAAALCHFYQSGVSSRTTKYKDWKDFAKKNPKKISK